MYVCPHFANTLVVCSTVKFKDMFSYYGSKTKIVDLFPPPKHSRIIEPFAGSAKYSLNYWQNDVLLVDKYEVIIKIWHFLQSSTEKSIMALPILKPGETLDDFNYLSEEEKMLIGFCINPGSSSPAKKQSSLGRFSKYWVENRNRIAKDVHKIKHWTIQLGTYDEIPNFPNVTWFIDPPYQFGGEYYRYSNKQLDFNHLAEWCKNREGQVIVCENTKADWLPFKPMKEMQGSKYKTVEAIWSNHITNYDNEQMSLFGGV